PEASSPGYDIVVLSRVGMLSQHRDASGVSLPSKVMSLDMSGSMGLAYAIMVALWEREKTGLGQRTIDVGSETGYNGRDHRAAVLASAMWLF
ncbi:MAG: CoA transferase, partial [Dehalococcoidia bacterium]|nr:CoA transferase [Dehalococcoidia bacterium]